MRVAGQGAVTQTANADTVKAGWLIASTNTAASTVSDKATAIEYAQHVFGRFGQGANSTVSSTEARAYSYAGVGVNTHGVMVSIFPEALGTTDVLATAGHEIQIKAEV